MPWAALVQAANVVNGSRVAVNKSAIQRFIAQVLAFAPTVQRGLGHPDPVGAEAAVLHRVAPANETLPRRCVAGKLREGAGRRIIRSEERRVGKECRSRYS